MNGSLTLEKLMNKKIAIAGLGVEGDATVRYLRKHKINCDVFDERLTDENEEIKKLTVSGTTCKTGREVFNNLKDYDVIFRSPGISPNRTELIDAQKLGREITSHTRLFFDLSPCPIIGITGTKGKGTTSMLVYSMLQKEGFDVYVGGNIGRPPLTFLDSLEMRSKVVLELSSFQLADFTKSPEIAVVLMITSEHMDYHKDISEYVNAKRNIIRFQSAEDSAVINRDYLASYESDIYTSGQVFQVSTERICEQGCYTRNGKVFVKRKGHEAEEIIDVKRILLPGKHNLENVCAAVMVATLEGVKKKNAITVLQTFKGLEHRLQFIREVDGVRYYDDSFSTTPETAIAAIEAFTQPEIIILGGSSKNSDFTKLGKTLRLSENVKAIIGIGVEWERIKEQLPEKNERFIVVEGADSMYTIVQAAKKIARRGDVVLLSPACASFGMFTSYKDRGEQFQREVKLL